MARIDEIYEKYNETGTRDLDLNELAILVNTNDSWDDDDLEALKCACPLYNDPVSEIDPNFDVDVMYGFCEEFDLEQDAQYIVSTEDYRAAFLVALSSDELDEEGRAAMEGILEDWDDCGDELKKLVSRINELIEDRNSAVETIDKWCEENHMEVIDELPTLRDNHWVATVERNSDGCPGDVWIPLYKKKISKVDIRSEEEYKKFLKWVSEEEERDSRSRYPEY